MGLILTVEGKRIEVKGEKEDGALSYRQLKDAVGGYIEIVRCDPEVTGGYDHFYCNEEGKLEGLPFNPEATKLSTWTADSDPIVGNIIFCKSGRNKHGENESY
jgi:hypothetical protein